MNVLNSLVSSRGLLGSPLLADSPSMVEIGTLGVAGLGGPMLGKVVFSVLALIACVTVHEFGHAYVADRLGALVELGVRTFVDWQSSLPEPPLLDAHDSADGVYGWPWDEPRTGAADVGAAADRAQAPKPESRVD